MIRNYLIPLLLFLPFLLPAQINDVELHDMDIQIEESYVDPATAIQQSIPARFKTGKPELFAYQGRYGYVLNDSILIQPEYQSLEKPYADFMIARNAQNYFGAINKQGKIILPFEYFQLARTPTGMVLAGKMKQGFGLLDAQGKVLLPLEYKDGRHFADSTVVLSGPGKQKIVKLLGPAGFKVVLEAGYEAMDKATTGDRSLFAVQENGLWGLMDYNKRLILPCTYDKIHRVYEDQAIAEKAGKWGVVSFQNKVLIPFVHDKISERLRYGYYRAGKSMPKSKWLWGMVDTTGRTLLEAKYDAIDQLYYCDFFKISQNGKKGLVDTAGNVIVPIQFGDIYELKHPEWAAQEGRPGMVKREVYGLYVKTKNPENDLLGLWQLNKGEILKPAFEWIEVLQAGGPYAVQKEDKKALFDGAGQQLTGFEYAWLGFGLMRPEIIVAGLPDRKTTLLRRSDGKPVQAEFYDEILPIRETDTGYMVSKSDGKWALHASNGKRLCPHQYTWIRNWDNSVQVTGLPEERVLVAKAAIYSDTGLMFFALDDTGAAYPVERG